MPSTFLRTSRHAKILGIARRGSLEEGDVEPRVRVIFGRTVAPGAERVTQVNGTGVSEDRVKIDDAHGVSQVIKDEIGDFEIPVDELLRLVGNDERRQRRKDVVSDTAHLIRQLGMHVLQFCEDKIRIVEVRDAALARVHLVRPRQ